MEPSGARGGLLFLDEREVCHREMTRAASIALPLAVTEGVELLDVAKFAASLFRNPAPQTEFERRVFIGLQRSEGQRRDAILAGLGRRQDARLLRRDCDDYGIEAQRQGAGHAGDLATRWAVPSGGTHGRAAAAETDVYVFV